MKNETIYVTKSYLPPYEEYIEAIKPLWESHHLTNMGKYHKELENELAVYLDVPEVSLMVNGHMALELCIQAFDFPQGGEVITTPFTFISTTHAIVRNGLTPVFCDVKESDGTIDESKIESLITENTVAILPVHVYGNACNVDVLEDIAFRYNLKVIYDAAHAFGESYKGVGIGNYGDASIFSFHATKVFHTVEGGAIVCKDRSLYEKLYDLKNFGIRGEELVVSVGANAKMNELSAIMGLCNLKHIETVIGARKKCFDGYLEKIRDMPGIRILFGDNCVEKRNYGYCPIVISDEYKMDRDSLYDLFLSNGIHSRKYFCPLTSDQACFKNKYVLDKLETARELSKRVLVIPLFDSMSESDQERILNILL